MLGVTFTAKRGRGVRRKTQTVGRVAHSSHLVPRHARLGRLDALVQAKALLLHNRVLADVVRHRRAHVALRAETASGEQDGSARVGAAGRRESRVAQARTPSGCRLQAMGRRKGRGEIGRGWAGAARVKLVSTRNNIIIGLQTQNVCQILVENTSK